MSKPTVRMSISTPKARRVLGGIEFEVDGRVSYLPDQYWQGTYARVQHQSLDQVCRNGMGQNVGEINWDCHAWIEATYANGEVEVLDYDDHMLKENDHIPKDTKLIRRPFNQKLQEQLNTKGYKIWKKQMKLLAKRGEEFTKYWTNRWINECGSCWLRCFTLKANLDRNKARESGMKQFKIVFGSLGYDDGKGIFWEYG